MSNNINLESTFRANTETVVKELDQACVILNLKTEAYYGLDEIGYQFYKQLITGKSVKIVLVNLVEVFNVDPKELENDLLKLIKDLTEAGILIENSRDV